MSAQYRNNTVGGRGKFGYDWQCNFLSKNSMKIKNQSFPKNSKYFLGQCLMEHPAWKFCIIEVILSRDDRSQVHIQMGFYLIIFSISCSVVQSRVE